MKALFLVLACLVVVSCVSTDPAPQNVAKTEAEIYQEKLEADRKAAKEKAWNEFEEYHKKQNDPVEINAKYAEALKTNKCEKENWSRYEQAENLQSLASKNKLTPYDLVEGDDYSNRKVNKFVLIGALASYTQYLPEMPEAFRNKYHQQFEAEADKRKNEKSVFNLSVKRDYDCYRKLK